MSMVVKASEILVKATELLTIAQNTTAEKRERVWKGVNLRQFPIHQEKSERKRGTSDDEYLKAIRSHATDETDDKRGRWVPDKGDSA